MGEQYQKMFQTTQDMAARLEKATANLLFATIEDPENSLLRHLPPSNIPLYLKQKEQEQVQEEDKKWTIQKELIPLLNIIAENKRGS